MKCSDKFVPSDLTAGVVLHNHEHTRQALLLGPMSYGPVGEDRRLALVFNTHSGARDLSNESEVPVAGWHIAEHYELGMDVSKYVSDVPRCLWKRDELSLRQVCPCGCGKVGLPCRCGYCDGDCEGAAQVVGAACLNCQSHGTCDCNCGCSDTTDDTYCSYCESNNVCSTCENTHDLYEAGLCGDCYQEKLEEDQRLEEEEERLEQERLAAAGAS
jgi:hypothetical protein